MFDKGLKLLTIDDITQAKIDTSIQHMANLLEQHWDLADTARRAISKHNRKRTDPTSIPRIQIGSHILYAMHKPDTKLDYIWRGPGTITDHTNHLTYTVKPKTEHGKSMQIHACRIRPFATAALNLTQQIREDIVRDHPDNIVQRILSHRYSNKKLWMWCHWKGFTKNADSYQEAKILYEDCPTALTKYYKDPKTKRTRPLTRFMRKHFPTLEK
jgi:hypothetical protein